MVSLSVMYILRTHLLEDPDVVFYYKGTDKEHGVPFALNAIVAFDPSDAMFFDKPIAMEKCYRLNLDKHALISKGYSEFDVMLFNS